MKKFDINIDEFVIGKVITLEEYDGSFKDTRSSYGYVKNFTNGRFLKFDNSKDAFIANIIAKNYADRYGDGALLIFCQIKNDTAAVCFIDTARIDKNDSIVKLRGLNASKYANDVNKIEDMFLYFQTSSQRAVRYFISGNEDRVAEIIKKHGHRMDEKMLGEFFPKPFLSPASKNSQTLKLAGIGVVPLLLVFFIGQGFVGSAAQRIESQAQKMEKERALLHNQVEQMKQNPFIQNETRYKNIDRKKVAI